MINYDILIDMKKSGCIDTGYELSQGDKELVEFNVILKNGSANYTPEGDSTIVFKKANNTTESGALIPDGNKFNYKIKGSELSVPGPVLAEIKTYDSETGRASSSRFKFWVKPDLAEYDTTETGTYIGELEHKIIEANALIDQLTQSRDEALVMIEELGVGNFINVNKIVNTTAVTEAGFVPDALLVKTNAEAISAINNNFDNLKLLTVLSNYGTIDAGGYLKIGRLIIVQVKFTASTNIPALTSFLWSLPTPLAANVPLLGNTPATALVINGMYVSSGGGLNSQNAITSGASYNISGCYISAS